MLQFLPNPLQPQGVATSLTQPSPDLLRLSNGLVSRDFLLQPAFATWDLFSGEADTSLLRAFSPEARLAVRVPGGEVVNMTVGGLQGQEARGYLNRWLKGETQVSASPGLICWPR